MTATRRPETEADFMRAVIDLAELRGWRVHHQRPARTADGWRSAITGSPGWPDLAMVRRGHLVLAELKSDRGIPTNDQFGWLAALTEVARAGSGEVSVHVWKPKDWPLIEECLR